MNIISCNHKLTWLLRDREQVSLCVNQTVGSWKRRWWPLTKEKNTGVFSLAPLISSFLLRALCKIFSPLLTRLKRSWFAGWTYILPGALGFFSGLLLLTKEVEPQCQADKMAVGPVGAQSGISFRYVPLWPARRSIENGPLHRLPAFSPFLIGLRYANFCVRPVIGYTLFRFRQTPIVLPAWVAPGRPNYHDWGDL